MEISQNTCTHALVGLHFKVCKHFCILVGIDEFSKTKVTRPQDFKKLKIKIEGKVSSLVPIRSGPENVKARTSKDS